MEKAKRKRRNIRDESSEVKRKEEKHGTMREMRQQEQMSETKREEIALNAVDLSELNQRRPAVSSDSALPLNIPGCEMD